MALSSTSRIQMRYAKESVFGEIDNTATTHDLRITGESLNFELTKESSNEINANRGATSMVATQAQATGSINGEMQYAEYDEFIAGTLQNAWVPFGMAGVSTPVDLNVTATTITNTASATPGEEFTLLKAGQWFQLVGLPDTSPNKGKLFRVSKTTAPTSTVITLDPGTPGAVETITGGTLSVSRLVNGVTQPSYTLEREVGDVGEYFAYRGMTPSSMTLAIATASLSTVEFAFMGRDALADDAGSMLPTPSQPSKSFDIMSGVEGVPCALWVGGAPLAGTFVNSINLTYDNTLRMQNAICSLGAVGIGSGTIQVTVDLEVFFAHGRAFYDDFLKNKNTEVAFTAFDVEGNGYVFTLPNANISSYTLNAGGKDQDLMASISLTGLLDIKNPDATQRGIVMIIDRIGAAVV